MKLTLLSLGSLLNTAYAQDLPVPQNISVEQAVPEKTYAYGEISCTQLNRFRPPLRDRPYDREAFSRINPEHLIHCEGRTVAGERFDLDRYLKGGIEDRMTLTDLHGSQLYLIDYRGTFTENSMAFQFMKFKICVNLEHCLTFMNSMFVMTCVFFYFYHIFENCILCILCIL